MVSQIDNKLIRSRIKLRHIQCFTEAVRQGSLKRAAERLNLTETAVKVAIHRLRKRFREALREEIAQTVAAERDVDAELRFLQAAIDG